MSLSLVKQHGGGAHLTYNNWWVLFRYNTQNLPALLYKIGPNHQERLSNLALLQIAEGDQSLSLTTSVGSLLRKFYHDSY